MTQKGRGRNAARRSGSGRMHANKTHPSYPPLPHHLNDPTQAGTQGHVHVAQHLYQYPLGGIPGLGLGFASNFPQLPNTWPTQVPQIAQSSDPSASREAMNSPKALEHASEEGEISEGEIEDIYDPQEVRRAAASGQHQSQMPTMANFGRDVAIVPASGVHANVGGAPSHTISATPLAQPNTSRDRSGSYSPYLSPREIDENGSTQILTKKLAGSSTGASKHMTDNAPIDLTIRRPSARDTDSEKDNTGLTDPLDSAKRDARDAIRKLLPYNVAYDTFVNEGVDRAVLDSLFTELGLGLHKNAESTQEKRVEPQEPPATNKDTASKSPKPGLISSPPTVQAGKTQDKSEERKDRIARLLAAKGSKLVNPTTGPTASLGNDPKAGPGRAVQPSPKLQSEKSRLLQQKMEALRKSRENLLRIKNQQQISNPPVVESQGGQASVPVTAAMVSIRSEGSSDAPEPPTRAPESAKPSSNPLTSPSIPGLYLSTPQGVHHFEHSMQDRRPTPISSESSSKMIQRPFDQQTESKPFLINVSDDEDDIEMDIDSPGRPISMERPQDSAIQNRFTLRETSFALHNVKTRNALTPSSVATPPRSSSHGGEDLESMNKKIEAMKRKIAEAEARKKTKASRQGSPSGSHQDSSRGTSTEPSRAEKDQDEAPLASEGLTPVEQHSIGAVPAASPHQGTPQTLKKQDASLVGRRSRSVAASERLPLIEARRREQLHKLQALQAQIAKLEQEIAEGEREEENLKQDLVASESDHENPVPQTTPPSVPPSPPIGDLPNSLDALDPSIGLNTAGVEVKPIEPEPEIPGDEISTSVSEDASIKQPLRAVDPAPEAVDHSILAANQIEPIDADQCLETSPDVVMVDYQDPANEEVEASDAYEPPEADGPNLSSSTSSPSVSNVIAQGDEQLPESEHEAAKSVVVPTSIDDPQDVVAGKPAAEASRGDTREDPGKSPSVRQGSRDSASQRSETQFVPYDTPLQYFRAFRYHPDYNKSVAGGLRSLTYSNKIDVRKEVCPDELAGLTCPRGSNCEYQHFETMKAPDDQILLQLGAAGSYQDAQKQEYIAGLRQLLTDFRNRKVKDFNAISQGIIDYRARFLGDRSKILPLGSVSL